jgi:hypothetical protein
MTRGIGNAEATVQAPWGDVLPLFRRGPVVVLTGAGVSTDSGVPGYRDESGAWMGAAPMQFADFMASPAARQRYWARSYLGYSRMAEAQPNLAHHALCALEQAGHISLLVTQNVDGLHQRSGSRRVLDLHGRLSQVLCMNCGYTLERSALQQSLQEVNRQWQASVPTAMPRSQRVKLSTFGSWVAHGAVGSSSPTSCFSASESRLRVTPKRI